LFKSGSSTILARVNTKRRPVSPDVHRHAETVIVQKKGTGFTWAMMEGAQASNRAT
jgi:hypothetical protein